MIKRLICFLWGHRYYVYAKPAEDWAVGIRWLKCRRCKRNFAMNDSVKALLPMDFELKDMHTWKKVKTCPRCGRMLR